MSFATFINSTGTVGIIYNQATQNITGSEFITLLGLIIIIITFFMLFQIPIEATLVLIMPMLIIYGVYSQDLIGFLGLTLLYLGVIFAKNFFVN